MVELERLNREIVTAIVERVQELTVVYEDDQPVDFARVVEEVQADVLIMGAHSVNADMVCDLLECPPRLKALAIDNDGQKGDLYEWRPRRTHLGELSPDTLLNAILESVQADCRELVR